MKHLHMQDIPETVPVTGYHGRFVHSETMTLGYWTIDANAELPEHSHPHEQVSSVLEGEFELTINGVPLVMGPGSVVIIPSHAPHSGKAITDCRIIDAWHPVREDYRT